MVEEAVDLDAEDVQLEVRLDHLRALPSHRVEKGGRQGNQREERERVGERREREHVVVRDQAESGP